MKVMIYECAFAIFRIVLDGRGYEVNRNTRHEWLK